MHIETEVHDAEGMGSRSLVLAVMPEAAPAAGWRHANSSQSSVIVGKANSPYPSVAGNQADICSRD